MPKKRNTHVPASYLILIQDNKVLLLRRYNTGFRDGEYSMVAGHVDEGETYTEAIIREAREEAGIDLEPEDLKVVHVMNRKRSPGFDNDRVDVFFVAEKWDGEIENKEPDRCDDLSWHDLDAIPKKTIPYIRQAIESLKNGVFYSEHGWEE